MYLLYKTKLQQLTQIAYSERNRTLITLKLSISWTPYWYTRCWTIQHVTNIQGGPKKSKPLSRIIIKSY